MLFTVVPILLIPFIPFGIWDLVVPIAWSVNYLVERFNGIDEGSLTPGRNYGKVYGFELVLFNLNH